MDLEYFITPPQNVVDELKLLLKQLLRVRTGEDPAKGDFAGGYTSGRNLGVSIVFQRLCDMIGDEEAIKLYSEYEKLGQWDWSKNDLLHK